MGIGEGGSSATRIAYLRLATVADVPVLTRLVHGLAAFERKTHECVATEDALRAVLFQHPPFAGPTNLLLELALPSRDETLANPNPPIPVEASSHDELEKRLEVKISGEIEDDEVESFASTAAPGSRVVVGFISFFPNYSSFQAKLGLCLGDVFVRGQYRRQGFGTVLLRAVARAAADRGYGRVDWPVMEWNANAIKFYEAMGASVQEDQRLCRITGANLQSYSTK